MRSALIMRQAGSVHLPEGHRTTVLPDPEGNEFWVIVSPEGWWPAAGEPPGQHAGLSLSGAGTQAVSGVSGRNRDTDR